MLMDGKADCKRSAFFYYIWNMKSFKSVSVLLSFIFLVSMSCFANTTITEKINTFDEASYDVETQEVCYDFNVVLEYTSIEAITSKKNQNSILGKEYGFENIVQKSKSLKIFIEHLYVESKRFPQPRDALIYTSE